MISLFNSFHCTFARMPRMPGLMRPSQTCAKVSILARRCYSTRMPLYGSPRDQPTTEDLEEAFKQCKRYELQPPISVETIKRGQQSHEQRISLTTAQVDDLISAVLRMSEALIKSDQAVMKLQQA